MHSTTPAVAEYLSALPADRRAALEAVRKVLLDNLDGGYEELIQYGMIGYAVPHRIFPPGYHCDPKQPLPFGGLASKKSHMSLHLMCLYGEAALEAQFRKNWEKTGRKLDMGQSCIRFKKLEDLALDVIGDLVRQIPASKYVQRYQELRALTAKAGGQKEKLATSEPAKKAASAVRKAPAKKKAAGSGAKS